MLIIVDCNYICHQAKHTLQYLSHEDQPTGVIFGFMKRLYKFAGEFETSRFAFAWDSGESLRRELFPEYKESRRREKTPEEQELDGLAYHQFDLLREKVLPALGFNNNFIAEGYEGDDVIASILGSNNFKTLPVVVASDNDLFQLLGKCRLYNPSTEKMYTRSDFKDEWGLYPDDWVMVKAIAGCSGDGVPGVQGVGDKTAAKYLRGELKKGKIRERIHDSKDILERNLKLVRLPFKGMSPVKLSRKKEKFDLDGFCDICEEYDFRSFLKKSTYDKWREAFGV